MRPTCALLCLVACGGAASNDVPPVAYQGDLPATVAARDLFDTLTVEGSIGSSTARPLLVDTGSPMTGVDPLSWPDAQLSSDLSSLPSLKVGSLEFTQVPSVPLEECGSSCGPYDVTGVVGGNILRSFRLGFDYQAPAVTLGVEGAGTDAESSDTVVGVGVEGGGMGTIAGGNGQVVDVPATRLVLQATIEGTARTLIVDTGSSYTLLRQSLYKTLVSDGRPQLTLEATTATGGAQSAVARSHTLSVGAAQATGSPIASVPDDQVDNLANEIGGEVDGLLGGSFLRAYYVIVDYGAQQIELHPYSTPDPLADEFDRVGVFLSETGDGYEVSEAVTSEQSLVGATLVSVDGTAIASLDPYQADRLLRGAPGTMHTLLLESGGAMQTITLATEDVLAL